MTTARSRLLLTLCTILLLAGCGGRVLIPTPSVYETSGVPLFTDLAPTLQRLGENTWRIDAAYWNTVKQ